MTTTASGVDATALARVSRMRTLSALLDDDAGVDAQLPPELLAMFAQRDARAAAEAQKADAQRAADFECVECRAHASEVFCEQCHDYFCELCFGGQHRKGNRTTHTFQPRLAPPTTSGSVRDASRDEQLLVSDRDGAKDDEDLEEANEEDEEEDDDSSEDDDEEDLEGDSDSSSPRRTHSRNLCDMVGHFFLGAGYPSASTVPRLKDTAAASTASLSHKGTTGSSSSATSMLERAKYIPVRLTYEERKLLRTLEAALSVSTYTDKLDTPALLASPAKRVRLQLQHIVGFLSGLAVASDYRVGQAVLDERNFSDHKVFFQELFELGRRYKIMNPEKMRDGEYGKLMYLLQDAMSPAIQDLLGFSCHAKIRTVYDVLADAEALSVLSDPQVETATMVVTPDGKSRSQIQRLIQQKERAVRALTAAYASRRLSRDTLQQCLYSIADNNYHLYFQRDPIDRTITLLTTHFTPENETSGDDTAVATTSSNSLAIVSGSDGARLSHSHARQFHYVLQSLTLWREVAHDMFRLWCLTDDDLLLATAADSTAYTLADTGQGLHRVQPAPRVARAMHVILHSTQRRLGHWVGSSVIHLGDKNVPNALMFIDKYTQVGHILRPVVKTVDSVDALCAASSSLRQYVDATFGGPAKLKRAVLADFFREAFDGSGADNFFEAGSCIDGRLTSAWNWCANLHTKPFFPVFKLAGFVGFDGKFG